MYNKPRIFSKPPAKEATMKKLTALVSFLFAAALAHAELVRPDPGQQPAPYTQPSYTAPTAPPSITFQMKNFWMEGAQCDVRREIGKPDIIRFNTTSPAQMSQPFIEACARGLQKAKWEKVTAIGYAMTPLIVESLREARTASMMCIIMAERQSPTVYEVRFSSFLFTGKDRELKDCLDAAEKAEDKAYPRIPYMPPSVRPSHNHI